MINVTKTSLPELKKYTKYLNKIWKTSWITNNGPLVKELEKKLAAYFDVKYLVLVNNGTSAIQLVLKTLKPRGEIITTPFTFAATTNSILWEGFTPVFADIDPDTFNIDPAQVEKRITKNTRAILAVHVYGNTCEIDKLQKIAKKHKIRLIFDAAHSFGAFYKNKPSASYGDCSTLSFHATKVFHTIEGGAILTNDAALFKKFQLLRNFGILEYKDRILLPGINAKMSEFQAAMGLVNLQSMGLILAKRKKIFDHYLKGLRNLKNIKLQKLVNSRHNYMYLPVCFNNIAKRDEIFEILVKNGINPRKYFFPLTTEFEYMKKLKIPIDKKSLMVSSDISKRVLCLPLYHDLDIKTVDKIVKIISEKI